MDNKKVCVIGGGPVGMEMGKCFNEAGILKG